MVVTLETERIEEVVQMMVITVTGTVSTTAEETEMTTVEAEVVAQEVTTAAAVMEAEVAAVMEAEVEAVMVAEMVAEMAEDLVVVQVVEENLDSIVTIARQKALVEVVDVVETTNVNLVIITIADESTFAASETGFDILQTPNAAYD